MDQQRKANIDQYRIALSASRGTDIDKYGGLFNGETNVALTETLELLRAQIPASVIDLKQALDTSTRTIIKSNERLANSTWWHSFFMIILTVVIAGAAVVQAIGTYKTAPSYQRAALIQTYRSLLETGTNAQILAAIEAKQPILKQNGGRFSTTDLDNYLGVFESVYTLYVRGQISFDDVNIEFLDAAEESLKNPEVKAYLEEIRRVDATYFAGLDELVAESVK